VTTTRPDAPEGRDTVHTAGSADTSADPVGSVTTTTALVSVGGLWLTHVAE
jgi:hypothetical protein